MTPWGRPTEKTFPVMKILASNTRRIAAGTVTVVAIILVFVFAVRREEPIEVSPRPSQSAAPLPAPPVVVRAVPPTATPDRVPERAAVPEQRAVPRASVAVDRGKADHSPTEADIVDGIEKRLKARRNVMRIYGPYLSQAKLGPENLSRIKELLTREMETPTIVNESLRETGVDKDSSVGAQAMLAALATTQQEVRQILGEEEYAKMGEMARAVRFQEAIESELQPNLYAADRPLSEAQSTAFAQRLAEFTRWDNDAFQVALNRLPDPTTGLTRMDLEFLRIAESILQPEQLEILRTSLDAKRVVERQKRGNQPLASVRLYKFDL
jgi:hypothetical protein